MFSSRYQRVVHLSWREKWRHLRALESYQAGLAGKVATVERYLIARLIGAAGPPIPAAWRITQKGTIWESDPDALTGFYLQVAKEALTAALLREHHAGYAIKLAEYLMYLERYVDAVDVLNEAVVQSPQDLRPVYALATIYRILGRARADEATHIFGSSFPERGVLLSTPAIEEACFRLGLSAQGARELAVAHFARVLRMNVHPDEFGTVEESLRVVQQMLQAKGPPEKQPTVGPHRDKLASEAVDEMAQQYLDSFGWTPEVGGFLMYVEALGHSTLMAFQKSSLLKVAQGECTALTLVREAFMYGLAAGDRMAHIGTLEETPARRREIARWSKETDGDLLERGARAYRDALAHEQRNADRNVTALLDRELQRDAMAAQYLTSVELKYEAMLQSSGGGKSNSDVHQAVEQANSLWLGVFTAGMLVGNGRADDRAQPASLVPGSLAD